MGLRSWAKSLVGARDALAELREHERALREEHERLVSVERPGLISRRPPVEDLVADVASQIDALGARWRAANADRVIAELTGSVDVAPSGAVSRIVSGNLEAAFPAPLGIDALAALVPAVLKAALSDVVRAVEYDAGPPMASRVPMVAELDRRVAEIEEAHNELVDQAAELGVTIPRLPAVAARLAEEARRRERAEADERANAAAARRWARS
jgi:hypothetical protein